MPDLHVFLFHTIKQLVAILGKYSNTTPVWDAGPMQITLCQVSQTDYQYPLVYKPAGINRLRHTTQ